LSTIPPISTKQINHLSPLLLTWTEKIPYFAYVISCQQYLMVL